MIALLLVLLPTAVLRAEAPAKKQAQIKGLLVVELANGSHAGTASQMNATVVPADGGDFGISFNQEVGELMEAATVEVEKFIRLRHPDSLPDGHRIELAFSDKYSPKDGPSAAVVSALLADAIITGDEIDPGFAATGDMTAAGEVRPVGGIVGKIRGAVKKECRIISIPETNKSAVADLYITDGIAPLYQIQIFSAETFEEARALAIAERASGLQEALEEFALVQKALRNNKAFINNSKVREKLRAVTTAAPNHLSARLLLLHASRRGPKVLSLPGSMLAIDRASGSFSVMMEDDSFLQTGSDDVLTGLIFDLSRLRPKLDKRTVGYSDSYADLCEYIKAVRAKKQWNAQLQRELEGKVARVRSERNKLLSNTEVREELMLE